jgi:uncharacterized membrane protein (DUF485 family)
VTHGPATQWGRDKSSGHKARVGTRMFLLYALVYAGFVVINTLNPGSMEISVLGLSLSILYGFGLIVLALVLALIYNGIATISETRLNDTDEEESL